jgi:hypothetical protein
MTEKREAERREWLEEKSGNRVNYHVIIPPAAHKSGSGSVHRHGD